MTGKFRAGIVAEGSRVHPAMTSPVCTVFIFTPHDGWLKQRYFWKCDHHISVWSHSPTGHVVMSLASVQMTGQQMQHFLPLKSEQIAVELLSILSWASFVGMPLTAGDSLFRCQWLDKMPSLIWAHSPSYSLGVSHRMLRSPSPINVCPSFSFYIILSIHSAAESLNSIEKLIGMFSGFHNLTE